MDRGTERLRNLLSEDARWAPPTPLISGRVPLGLGLCPGARRAVLMVPLEQDRPLSIWLSSYKKSGLVQTHTWGEAV